MSFLSSFSHPQTVHLISFGNCCKLNFPFSRACRLDRYCSTGFNPFHYSRILQLLFQATQRNQLPHMVAQLKTKRNKKPNASEESAQVFVHLSPKAAKHHLPHLSHTSTKCWTEVEIQTVKWRWAIYWCYGIMVTSDHVWSFFIRSWHKCCLFLGFKRLPYSDVTDCSSSFVLEQEEQSVLCLCLCSFYEMFALILL